MNYTVEDSDLIEKLDKLKINVPETLTIIPENVDNAINQSEFIFPDSAIEFKKVFRLNQLEVESLGEINSTHRSRKNADLYAPAIFVSFSLLTDNQNLIAISLNLISNYLTDWFKGRLGSKKVKLDVYVETDENKTVKKIKYEGDPEGLKNLDKVIKSLK